MLVILTLTYQLDLSLKPAEDGSKHCRYVATYTKNCISQLTKCYKACGQSPLILFLQSLLHRKFFIFTSCKSSGLKLIKFINFGIYHIYFVILRAERKIQLSSFHFCTLLYSVTIIATKFTIVHKVSLKFQNFYNSKWKVKITGK